MAPICKVDWFRPFPPQDCFRSGKREEQILKNSFFKSEILAMRRNHSNFYVFDLFEWICPDGQEYCSIMSTEGLPLYKDADHFTDLGSRMAFDHLMKWVKEQGLLG